MTKSKAHPMHSQTSIPAGQSTLSVAELDSVLSASTNVSPHGAPNDKNPSVLEGVSAVDFAVEQNQQSQSSTLPESAITSDGDFHGYLANPAPEQLISIDSPGSPKPDQSTQLTQPVDPEYHRVLGARSANLRVVCTYHDPSVDPNFQRNLTIRSANLRAACSADIFSQELSEDRQPRILDPEFQRGLATRCANLQAAYLAQRSKDPSLPQAPEHPPIGSSPPKMPSRPTASRRNDTSRNGLPGTQAPPSSTLRTGWSSIQSLSNTEKPPSSNTQSNPDIFPDYDLDARRRRLRQPSRLPRPATSPTSPKTTRSPPQAWREFIARSSVRHPVGEQPHETSSVDTSSFPDPNARIPRSVTATSIRIEQTSRSGTASQTRGENRHRSNTGAPTAGYASPTLNTIIRDVRNGRNASQVTCAITVCSHRSCKTDGEVDTTSPPIASSRTLRSPVKAARSVRTPSPLKMPPTPMLRPQAPTFIPQRNSLSEVELDRISKENELSPTSVATLRQHRLAREPPTEPSEWLNGTNILASRREDSRSRRRRQRLDFSNEPLPKTSPVAEKQKKYAFMLQRQRPHMFPERYVSALPASGQRSVVNFLQRLTTEQQGVFEAMLRVDSVDEDIVELQTPSGVALLHYLISLNVNIRRGILRYLQDSLEVEDRPAVEQRPLPGRREPTDASASRDGCDNSKSSNRGRRTVPGDVLSEAEAMTSDNTNNKTPTGTDSDEDVMFNIELDGASQPQLRTSQKDDPDDQDFISVPYVPRGQFEGQESAESSNSSGETTRQGQVLGADGPLRVLGVENNWGWSSLERDEGFEEGGNGDGDWERSVEDIEDSGLGVD